MSMTMRVYPIQKNFNSDGNLTTDAMLDIKPSQVAVKAKIRQEFGENFDEYKMTAEEYFGIESFTINKLETGEVQLGTTIPGTETFVPILGLLNDGYQVVFYICQIIANGTYGGTNLTDFLNQEIAPYEIKINSKKIKIPDSYTYDYLLNDWPEEVKNIDFTTPDADSFSVNGTFYKMEDNGFRYRFNSPYLKFYGNNQIPLDLENYTVDEDYIHLNTDSPLNPLIVDAYYEDLFRNILGGGIYTQKVNGESIQRITLENDNYEEVNWQDDITLSRGIGFEVTELTDNNNFMTFLSNPDNIDFPEGATYTLESYPNNSAIKIGKVNGVPQFIYFIASYSWEENETYHFIGPEQLIFVKDATAKIILLKPYNLVPDSSRISIQTYNRIPTVNITDSQGALTYEQFKNLDLSLVEACQKIDNYSWEQSLVEYAEKKNFTLEKQYDEKKKICSIQLNNKPFLLNFLERTQVSTGQYFNPGLYATKIQIDDDEVVYVDAVRIREAVKLNEDLYSNEKDWEELNPFSSSYIKNKPFYLDLKTELSDIRWSGIYGTAHSPEAITIAGEGDSYLKVHKISNQAVRAAAGEYNFDLKQLKGYFSISSDSDAYTPPGIYNVYEWGDALIDYAVERNPDDMAEMEDVLRTQFVQIMDGLSILERKLPQIDDNGEQIEGTPAYMAQLNFESGIEIGISNEWMFWTLIFVLEDGKYDFLGMGNFDLTKGVYALDVNMEGYLFSPIGIYSYEKIPEYYLPDSLNVMSDRISELEKREEHIEVGNEHYTFYHEGNEIDAIRIYNMKNKRKIYNQVNDFYIPYGSSSSYVVYYFYDATNDSWNTRTIYKRSDLFKLTEDTSVVTGKQYYLLTTSSVPQGFNDVEAQKVTNPVDAELSTYYEVIAYEPSVFKTEDEAPVSGKTYYYNSNGRYEQTNDFNYFKNNDNLYEWEERGEEIGYDYLREIMNNQKLLYVDFNGLARGIATAIIQLTTYGTLVISLPGISKNYINDEIGLISYGFIINPILGKEIAVPSVVDSTITEVVDVSGKTYQEIRKYLDVRGTIELDPRTKTYLLWKEQPIFDRHLYGDAYSRGGRGDIVLKCKTTQERDSTYGSNAPVTNENQILKVTIKSDDTVTEEVISYEQDRMDKRYKAVGAHSLKDFEDLSAEDKATFFNAIAAADASNGSVFYPYDYANSIEAYLVTKTATQAVFTVPKLLASVTIDYDSTGLTYTYTETSLLGLIDGDNTAFPVGD